VKRKLAWGSLALLVIVAAAWLLWPRDPINPATYHKIRMGMTLAEAEALVGRPSIGIAEMMDVLFKQRRVRWQDPKPEDVLHEGNDWSGGRPDLATLRCWEGTHGGIAVQLDADGRVIGKRFEPRPVPGPGEYLRGMLGW
jgi:hypothetical protein